MGTAMVVCSSGSTEKLEFFQGGSIGNLGDCRLRGGPVEEAEAAARRIKR